MLHLYTETRSKQSGSRHFLKILCRWIQSDPHVWFPSIKDSSNEAVSFTLNVFFYNKSMKSTTGITYLRYSYLKSIWPLKKWLSYWIYYFINILSFTLARVQFVLFLKKYYRSIGKHKDEERHTEWYFTRYWKQQGNQGRSFSCLLLKWSHNCFRFVRVNQSICENWFFFFQRKPFFKKSLSV